MIVKKSYHRVMTIIDIFICIGIIFSISLFNLREKEERRERNKERKRIRKLFICLEAVEALDRLFGYFYFNLSV